MTYQLTLENYYSLASHCCSEFKYYSFGDKNNNRIENFISNQISMNGNGIHLTSGSLGLTSSNYVAMDELSRIVLGINQLEPFDFIGLNELCQLYLKKFPGLRLQMVLWRTGIMPARGWGLTGFLVIGEVWGYFLSGKDHIMVLSDQGKLFVQSGVGEEAVIYEYDKYKELEAFI